MKSLEIEDIKEILRTEIRKQILHSHHVFEGTNRWDDTGIEKSLDSIQKKETNLKDVLKSDLKSYQGEVDSKLEGILGSMDILAQKDSVDFKRLRNNFIDLYLLRHEWMRELVDKTGKTDDQFRRDAELKLGLELFPELSELSDSMLSEDNRELTEGVRQVKKQSGKRISECAELFYDRKLLEDTSPKEIQTLRQNINDFIEVIGDLNISTTTKGEVSEFITIQSKLPSNRKKSPKYRDLTISELLKKKGIEPQTPQNINKRLTKLSVFGNWCVRQGYLTGSPFKDMKLSVKKTITGRIPFSVKELRTILAPETYRKWTVEFKHPHAPSHKEGGAKNQMSYYWIFLLGILSGMRTNEMCQLRLSDLKKEKGIWFIHVEESEDTKVKTINSIRKIPVHPQLLELGFMQYVGNMKRKKKDRVFWELTKTRDGYSKQVSRHYNERFLPALGVWKKNVKVLYCTRHTFINCLYQKNADENIIKSLVGHEKEFTMKHYGGDPFTPERLLKEISKVSYSGINWKSLKVV
jgi:integrase